MPLQHAQGLARYCLAGTEKMSQGTTVSKHSSGLGVEVVFMSVCVLFKGHPT